MSLGGAALDLAIILLSCVVRTKATRALGFAPDTQALLPHATEREDGSREAGTRDQDSDWVPLGALSHHKSPRTVAAISGCMELTREPVPQVGCSATRLPGDGQTRPGDLSLKELPSLQPKRVPWSRVSSSSSSEAFSVITDLEQDPEDVSLEGDTDSMETTGPRNTAALWGRQT